MRNSDTPLPGDLVIREQQDASGVCAIAVFEVCTWPYSERSAGPYLNYDYAQRQARVIASQRHVLVWRQYPQGDLRSAFDNVTDE